MTKKNVNPLFVDSTRFQGDLTTTQLELKNVIIFDGEELVALVGGPSGRTSRVPMALSETLFYEAHVHLSYQQPFTVQFVIEKDGVLSLKSARYAARAQYVHVYEWEHSPTADEQPTIEEVPVSRMPAALDSRAAWAHETSRALKSLIDKWDL